MPRATFYLFQLHSFRWLGDFTWIATGPSAEGRSEPLPLPSTIVGAIASLSSQLPRGRRFDPSKVLELARKVLEDRGVVCQGKVVFRGPYIPVRESSIALHLWPSRLFKIEKSGASLKMEILKPNYVSIVGTALKIDTKSVTKHLLYTQSLIDPIALRNLGLEPVIAMDILNCALSREKCLEEVVRLGGEGRVAKLVVERQSHLQKTLEKLWEGEWSRTQDKIFTYLASPALLERKDLRNILNSGEVTIIEGARVRIPRVREVKQFLRSLGLGDRVEELAKRLRVKVAVLAPGFDMARKCLRPLYFALMPGSLLIVENIEPEKIFEKGLGMYTEAGWGTLVPIPMQ